MSSSKRTEDILNLQSNSPFASTSNSFTGNLFTGGHTRAPNFSHEDAINRMLKTNDDQYKKGNTTFTWREDSYTSASGPFSPHDGESQVRVDVDHSKTWSTRSTFSPDNKQWTLSTGSKDNAAKWRRDRDGAEFIWDHKVRHNNDMTSHFETGVRNTDSGPMAIFRWALGFNSK
ncbi:hypothetical protein NW768_009678 [Fusarium equiseti]|uniref:Uncharacterized protein n=1 Tax=Fusarium equiseti TaxID=61235 RepID=A0ABQ8R2G0_FUSEQ|nr:hypothetical protein NW768_009678 [Fusarium equiseti]